MTILDRVALFLRTRRRPRLIDPYYEACDDPHCPLCQSLMARSHRAYLASFR